MRRLVLPVLIACLAAPVCAQNPKITLQLDQASLAEAAAALSRETGVSIRVPGVRPGGVDGAPLEQRSTFNWQGVSFGEALRQLCLRYGLRAYRSSGGWFLQPGVDPAPAQTVGKVEKSGITLSVQSIEVNYRQTLRFDNGNAPFDQASLRLQFLARVAEGEPERLYGIDHLTGQDDLGNVLGAERDPFSRGFFASARYPDETVLSGGFGVFSPRAHRLKWIEGDLLAYRKFEYVPVELRVPDPGKTAVKELDGKRVEVSLEEQPRENRGPFFAPPPALLQRPNRPEQAGPWLYVSVTTAADDAAASRNDSPGWLFYDAEGKLVSLAPGGTSTASRGDVVTYSQYTSLAEVERRPVRAVVRLARREDPITLFHFRMENVPLPGGEIVGQQNPRQPGVRPVPNRLGPNPPGPNPPAPNPPAPAERVPQEQSGTLVSRVRILNKPAGEGTLALGLSLKTGDDWSAIRWLDAPVDATGAARLGALKPGTYRVLRVYRPKETLQPGEGRWLGSEATVTVTAGKETLLPVLEWVKDPAGPRK